VEKEELLSKKLEMYASCEVYFFQVAPWIDILKVSIVRYVTLWDTCIKIECWHID